MTAWPYIHTASAAITPEGEVSVAGPEPAAVTIAGFELGGVADMGSPETLMTCAVAWSFARSFRTETTAAGIPWETLELGVDGTVDRHRGGARFARFDITLDIRGAAERAPALRRAAERALRECLVANSLAAPAHVAVRLQPATRTATAAEHGREAATTTAAAHG